MTSLSALVALAWMVPFALGARLHAGTSRTRRAWLSAAGGAAVAYVFLDLLPEMERMQRQFSAAASGIAFPFPFPHYRVYTSALAGFVLFYTIEHMAAATRTSDRDEERPLVYGTQIAGFTVYVGLMAYVLRVDADVHVLSIALYGIAMFLHFWIVDHALREEHGARYTRTGHWVPCLGIVAGWGVAAGGVGSDLVVPTLMGLVAGGVVLNSVKGELPGEGQGRPVPFIAGAAGYAMLLLLVG